MFYLRYIASELRRRPARTALTAIGLAVGVGLVVTVVALSRGLDDAQSEVLKPLTGVGTDMSVNRPIVASGSGSNQTFQPGPGGAPGGGPGGISGAEQEQLRKENGDQRVGLANLGKPGKHFDRTSFISNNLSYAQKNAESVAKVAGVAQTAPALTLSTIHTSGKVPKQSQSSQPRVFGGGGGGAAGGGPPNSIKFDQASVSGVDTSAPDLGLVTPSQIVKGRYFQKHPKEAVLSQSYASQHSLDLGDKVNVGGTELTVVGIAKAPLGGQSSDIYMHLPLLQKLSDRKGRINVLRVRATNASEVSSVAAGIKIAFPGAQVTTAKDLADRVSGSLVDAKNLSNKLGTALAIVALAAAFLIAILLTLSSVNKRTRELGTLKAIGWRQRLVVRQITGESLTQGALGGILGALVGIGGCALITAFGPTLQATVAQAAQGGGPGQGPGPLGAFGQGQVSGGSSSVSLSAPVDVSVLLLAIGLALLGGLLAGAVGASRAARLQPAEALRSLE